MSRNPPRQGKSLAVDYAVEAGKMNAKIISGLVLISIFLASGPAPAQKAYRFSTDWVSSRVSVWQEVLAPFKDRPNLNYLEIGVFEGRSAIWMMEHILTHPSARMTLIDLFPGDLKERFLGNLKVSGFESRTRVITGLSEVALRSLPPDSFDIIYIDGSHKARDVLADAVLSWRLLKKEGLMIFDDYSLNRGRYADYLGPAPAIDSFLSAYRDELQVVAEGIQMVVRKIRNPCQEVVIGCSPIGKYIYFWDEGVLGESPDGKMIALNERENSWTRVLVESKRPGRDEYQVPEAFSKIPEFLDWASRLGLGKDALGKDR
jgi:predicted O-methyltransferase YrrM